jgi:UDP-2-acetamido-2-deoxy-ribo-hexuluronate aminotransferase
MDAINAIARKHGNIPVIEDAAQSFGATYRSADGVVRKSCNLSSIGCTSFFPSKPLGCYGDGGAIFTNDDLLAKALREIRVHGQERRYYHTRVGVGGRMDTLQCAVVLAKLDRFEWEVQRRKELGALYQEKLAAGRGAVSVISVRPDRDSVWAQFTVLVSDRSKLQAVLEARGVPTAVHYPVPLNCQPAYRHLCCSDCTPNSQWAAERVISLPMGPDLDLATLDFIVAVITEALAD